jgi:predicted amidohydrolase
MDRREETLSREQIETRQTFKEALNELQKELPHHSGILSQIPSYFAQDILKLEIQVDLLLEDIYKNWIFERKFLLSGALLSAFSKFWEENRTERSEKLLMSKLFFLHEFYHLSQGIDSATYPYSKNSVTAIKWLDYAADAFAAKSCFQLAAGENPWHLKLAKVLEAHIKVGDVFSYLDDGRKQVGMDGERFHRQMIWHFQYARAMCYRPESNIDDFNIELPVFMEIFKIQPKERRTNLCKKKEVKPIDLRSVEVQIFRPKRIRHPMVVPHYGAHLVKGLFQNELRGTVEAFRALFSDHPELTGRRDDKHSHGDPLQRPLSDHPELTGRQGDNVATSFELQPIDLKSIKKERAKILIAQPEWESGQIERDENQLYQIELTEKDEKVIDSILGKADEEKVDLVVFPEFSIPPKYFDKIQKWSTSKSIVVIAGSTYIEREGKFYNTATIFFAGALYQTEKRALSPHERSHVLKLGPSEGLKHCYFQNTPIGNIAVMICSDEFNPHIRGAFLNQDLDILCVIAVQNPAYTHHQSIDTIIKERDSNRGIYVVYCNALCKGTADGRSAFFGNDYREAFAEVEKLGLTPSDGIAQRAIEMPAAAGCLIVECNLRNKVVTYPNIDPNRYLIRVDFPYVFENERLRQLTREEVSERSTKPTKAKAASYDDQRTLELAYLNHLQDEERLNQERQAKLYTYLKGEAQKRRPQARAPYERRSPREGEPQKPKPVPDVIDEILTMKQAALLGEPGSGKTTTLWLLAVNLLEAARKNPAAPIPLLIRLGRWTDAGQSLEDFIKSQLGKLGAHLDALLKKKRAALLLDGLNELPVSQRESKYPLVQQFIEKNKKKNEELLAIVSCRELDYTIKLNFDTINILPLDPVRIREFVKRDLGDEQGEQMFWTLAGEDARKTYEQFEQKFSGKLSDPMQTFWNEAQLPPGLFWGWDLRGEKYNDYWESWLKQRETPTSLMLMAYNPYMLSMLDAEFDEGDGKLGSGSAGGDKREIVAMQKEAQTKLVHLLRLGKRQGLAHKACESLSQRVVPALDMGGLPGLFAARRMVLVGQDFLIGFPKVRKAMPAPKHRRNALPQLLTSGGAAIPRHIGNDLPGLAAQGNPDPMFIGFFHHK